MKQRILVVTGRYYPNPSANGICIKNVIDELHRHNCDVTCICYDDYRNCDYGATKVYKVSRGLLQSLSYILEKCENINPVAKYVRKVIDAGIRVCGLLYLPIWPWVDPYCTLKTFVISVYLHRRFRYHRMITVHMPISSLIVGHMMKRLYPEMQYYPYFLDSLSGGRPLRFMSERWNRNRKLNWETILLNNADKIFVMESHREHHSKYSHSKPYYNRITYCDIPLFVEREYVEPTPRKDETIKVLFCGTMTYPMRNVYYLLKIIDNMKTDNIKFVIIGATNVKQLKTNVRSNIEYIPHIGRDKLDSYYEQADVLLNLGVQTPCAISGKIFEYISYRKPIISTYSIDNEACIPYLTRYPLCLMLDERETDIAKQISTIKEFINITHRKEVSERFVGNEYIRNNPISIVREFLQ